MHMAKASQKSLLSGREWANFGDRRTRSCPCRFATALIAAQKEVRVPKSTPQDLAVASPIAK